MLLEFRFLEFPGPLIAFSLLLTKRRTATLENLSPIRYKIILHFKNRMLTSMYKEGIHLAKISKFGKFPERVLDFLCKRRAEGCFSKEQGRLEALLGLRMRKFPVFQDVVLSRENNDFPFS